MAPLSVPDVLATATSTARTVALNLLGPLAVGAGFAELEKFDQDAAQAAANLILDEVREVLADRISKATTAEDVVRDLVTLKLVLDTVARSAEMVRAQLIADQEAEAAAGSGAAGE